MKVALAAPVVRQPVSEVYISSIAITYTPDPANPGTVIEVALITGTRYYDSGGGVMVEDRSGQFTLNLNNTPPSVKFDNFMSTFGADLAAAVQAELITAGIIAPGDVVVQP